MRLKNSKKSLKIPKRQSESVYLRRTDNTMAKTKSTKGQTTINKTYIYKEKNYHKNIHSNQEMKLSLLDVYHDTTGKYL
jgi:hypothetical protein